MFTKEDYADYCRQIIELERKMESDYLDVAAKLKTSEYREAFEKLAREEDLHARTATELLNNFITE